MGDEFWEKVHKKGVDAHEFATKYVDAAERSKQDGAGKLPDPNKALEDFADKGYIYLEED